MSKESKVSLSGGKQISAHCSWHYWTGLCSIMVLEENCEVGSYCDVALAQAFGKPEFVHKWDGDGVYLPVTCECIDEDLSLNRYHFKTSGKKGDCFCVYYWEFK